MFDPSKASQAKLDALAKKRAQASVKEKCIQLVPMELQEGLLIDVKEVQCGDPNCSPIDTVITMVWAEGGENIFLQIRLIYVCAMCIASCTLFI